MKNETQPQKTDAKTDACSEVATVKKPDGQAPPWYGGKIVKWFDGTTKKMNGFAIEDADGIIWSGKAVQSEVHRQQGLQILK